MQWNNEKGYGLAALWLVLSLILTHTDMPHWMMMFCFVMLCYGISMLTDRK